MAAAVMAEGTKFKRGYLGHALDENFGTPEPSYKRLGKDISEYNINFNAEVKQEPNILDENSVQIEGYKLEASADPYYAEKGDKIFMRMLEAGMEGITNDALNTTIVDFLLDQDGSCIVAYKHDVVVVPTSIGGSSGGIKIPFTIHYAGNMVKGKYDPKLKKFTPDSEALAG